MTVAELIELLSKVEDKTREARILCFGHTSLKLRWVTDDGCHIDPVLIGGNEDYDRDPELM